MSEFDLLSFRRFQTIIMILNKIKLLFILQLEKLLEEVRKVTLNEKGEFSSKSALFVCNKLDQIPQKEIEEVKKYVIRKLEKCWPGLVPESQIIYMSAKKAIDAQKLGIVTNDFLSLMNGIRSTVMKSIEARLESYWR